MRVVFCSSEVFPFAKTGGLGDVCGALPLALERLGVRPVVFLPYYKCVRDQNFEMEQIGADLFRSRIGRNIDVFFIRHDFYFMRDGLYSDSRGDYVDNLDRFQFFCQRVMELLKSMNYPVDVFHCHDWQTALIPVYLKEWYAQDSFYKNTKSLLTIHNLAYQGVFPQTQYSKLRLPSKLFSPDTFEFYGSLNLLKAGILLADEVTTVSPQYAREIQTKQFGFGLNEVLRHSRKKIVGVLNGLDYDVWDPAKDELLEMNYSPDTHLKGKAFHKQLVQKRLSLPQNPDTPILGMVGRISHQKGIDLILDVLPQLLKEDVQVIVQGLGHQEFIDELTRFSQMAPNKMAVCFKFDESLAHLLYAGSDFFLMPSEYEPCGLSQMIALKYGTPPIVYETGGLADTVAHFNPEKGSGNGFVFSEYIPACFLKCILDAVSVYHQDGVFSQIVENAMLASFPWDESAKRYAEIYQCL